MMALRFALGSELDQWDKLILNNPDYGNVFQSREFAEQKRLSGWTPRYILADKIALTVLEKSVPVCGKIWYLPKGPGITTTRQLEELLLGVKDFALNNGVFLIKIEPELIKTSETMADLLKLGLLSASPIQPNFSTIQLDISPDEETLLAALPQKGRHAIKRAERDGVTVEQVEPTDENCHVMYQLLSYTAAGSFRIRSYNYYKAFWQNFNQAKAGQLLFAQVENKVVAGAYGLVFGSKSTYKDGASVHERTVYGASHLLQWHLILWAKSRGALTHDFCGSPPKAEINNPAHPHYGIGRFKLSFNKEVADYVGVFDVVVRPQPYRIWKKIGERLAVKLYSYQHHENYY